MDSIVTRSVGRAMLLCLALTVSWPAGSAPATVGTGPAAAFAAPEQAMDPEFRLAAVGYRLALANSALCDNPVMLTGLMVHNIGDYAPRDRAAANAQYALTSGFGVLHVVGGSPADRAGLQEGDEIVAVDGVSLARFHLDAIRTKASFDRTETFVDDLEIALAKGPASLTVRHQSDTAELVMPSQPGCGGRFAMIHQGAADAWSDGSYVAVTEAMVRLAADDSELAFVVAHEMAHNIAHDADRKNPFGSLLLQFGLGAAPVKQAEIRADTAAVTFMANAGYDVAAPERLLRKSGGSHWMDLAITHPGIGRRITIVRAAAALVDPRLAAGQAVLKSEAGPYPAGTTIR